MIPFTPDERRAQFAPSQVGGNTVAEQVQSIIGAPTTPTMAEQVDFAPPTSASVKLDVADIVNADRTALMSSLMHASRINPDKAAEAQRLAQQTGVGQDIALRNMDELRQRAFMSEMQQRDLANTNPILAQYLKDREFASQASDDVGVLSNIETIVQPFREEVERIVPDTYQPIGLTPSSPLFVPSLVFPPLMMLPNPIDFGAVGTELGKGFRRGRLIGQRGTVGTLAALGLDGGDLNKAAALQKEMQELGRLGLLGTSAEMVGQMYEMKAEMLTGAAAGATVGSAFGPKGTIVGGGFGVQAGMVAGVAKMEAGNLYADMVADGVSPEIARNTALVGGFINGLIELASFKILAAPFKQLTSKLLKEGVHQALRKTTMRSAVTAAAKSYGLQVGANAGQEALQEAVAIVAEEVARASDGLDPKTSASEAVNRILESAVYGAAGASILGAIGPGANLVYDINRANRTVNENESFADLARNGKNAKLATRNPRLFERFLRRQVQGTRLENVYIDAATAQTVLAQAGVTATQIDAVIPGFSQQLAEAAAVDGTVIIPSEQYIARLDGTAIGDALSPHIRTSADGYSLTEANALLRQRQQMMAEANEVLAQQSAAEGTFVEEANAIKDQFVTALKNAGRDELQANAEAAIYQAIIVTQASEAKMTPNEWMQRYGLREVTGADMPAAVAPLKQVYPDTIAQLTDDELRQLLDYAYEVDAIQDDIDALETELDRREVEEDDPAGGDDEPTRSTTGLGIEELMRQMAQIGRRDNLSPEQLGASIRSDADFAVITQAEQIAGVTDAELGQEAYDALAAHERRIAGMRTRLAANARTAPLEQASRIDADYLAAVKRGDMETAQRMVDEAAERSFSESVVRGDGDIGTAGKILRVYHGSGAFIRQFMYEFTGQGVDQLGSGFYFTTDRPEAESYMTRRRDVETVKIGGESQPTVVEAYLDIRNPLRADKIGSITWEQIRKFIAAAPDETRREGLENWGIDGDVPSAKVLDAYAFKDANVVRELFKIGNDFYGRNTKAFNRAIRDILGYDGVVQDFRADGVKKLHYVAFFPEQIKSADPVTYDESGNVIPLSRRFDITSPRIFEQAANEEAAQIDAQAEAISDDDVLTAESQPDIPQSIDDAISLEAVARLATGQTWDRGRDLKVAMQEEANRLAQEAGVNISLDTPQTAEYLKRIGVRDALYALRQNPNSVGWYDEKTRQAIAVMALVHPELLKDENARFAFTWALAVTSNGIKVDKNFELANAVYSQYKRDGRMPTDLTAGQAQAAINRSLGMFNDLVDAWGIDNLRKFTQTEYTVQELRYLVQDFDASGEFARTVVKGAGILGPKIGNGFFSNLYGDFRSLTMDRWLIRTWGRWTGTLIKAMPVQTEKARVRLETVVRSMNQERRTELGAVLREYADGTQEFMDAFEAGEAVDFGVLASLVQKASMDVDGRAKMNATETGQEFRKAGNSLAKYLDGQKEAPSGPRERVQIRSIFGDILRELQQLPEYAELTMADLQAALWYAEKRLYETAREDIQVDEESIEGYADEEAPDYANAAAKVARSSGISENRIASALKKESKDERSRRARSQDAAGQPIVGRDTGAVGGFTAAEKRRFNGAAVIRGERSNRGAVAGSPRAYERRGRETTPKPRLVKKLGANVIAEYGPARRLRNALKVVGDSEKQFGTPNFFELEKSAKSADAFHTRIMQSKEQNDFGASVFAYSVSEYESMRLFLSDDGTSGFALKGDDIVSVFSMSDQSMLHALMEMAVSAGGRRLDAFDTVLPHFYAPHGFRAVSRLRWDDKQAPSGWNKETFRKFNNGEPDVVFMVYDPAYFGQYSTKDAKVARSYAAAVRAQDADIAQMATAGMYQQAARGRFEQRPITPGFYSALERELTALDAKALTASGWGERFKGLIAKGAIKADELEWSGLVDYLKMQEGKVSKDAVLEFLRGNGVRVERVSLGELPANIDELRNALARAEDAHDAARAREDAADRGNDEAEALAATEAANQTRRAVVQAKMALEDAERAAKTKYNRAPLVLRGGTNYREVLLTLPEVKSKLSGTDMQGRPLYRYGELPTFTSSHWDQPNVLVHLRMNDRVDADGKRVLFVEEVQSDWGQAGRKKGFAQTVLRYEAFYGVDKSGQEVVIGYGDTPQEAQANVDPKWREVLGQDAIQVRSVVKEPTGLEVARAPFVETTDGWLNLGLKQIMLEAVRGNYDRVAFVNGEQSAERYDLSKQVSSITYEKDPQGRIYVEAKRLDGSYAIEKNKLSLEEVEDMFGKEIAKKIDNDEGAFNVKEGRMELSGLDLKVGGEGMVAFYDKIVPAAMSKLLKKYGGVKVGTVVLPNMQKQKMKADAERMGMTVQDVLDVADESEYAQAQLGFDVTPELVKKLESGLPLFQAAKRGPRGGLDPERLRLLLTTSQDSSTVIHELAHFLLVSYSNMARDGNATPQMLADLDELLRWRNVAGDSPQQRLTTWLGMSIDQQRTALHEALAYSFEVYVMEGKAPTAELQSVFDRLRLAMLRVYRTIRDDINRIYRENFGEDLPMLTPEVRGVFDRMLASREAIQRQATIDNMKALFQTQEQSGMNDQEWAAYQAMETEAIEASVTDLTTASLRQMQWLGNARSSILRDLQKKHDAARKEVASEVAAVVRARPVYRAMTYLRYGKFVDADGQEIEIEGTHKLDLDTVRAMYEFLPEGQRLDITALSRGKYGLVGKDGLNPDLLAEAFGYSSGDQMIRELLAARPIKDEIADQTDMEMTRRYGDMNNAQAQEMAVQSALHNEARARFVAVELRFLAKATEPVRLMLEAARQVAQSILADKRLRDIRPSDYVAGEARAARDAKTIIEDRAKRDTDAAQERAKAFESKYGSNPEQQLVRAKRAQLYQNQLAKESMQIAEQVDADIKYLRRVLRDTNVKRMGADAADQIAQLLQKYELAAVTLKRLDARQSLKDYLAQQEADGLLPDIAPEVIAESNRVNYRELTVKQFRDLVEAVKQIEYIGKNQRTVQLAAQRAEYEQKRDEVVARIREVGAERGLSLDPRSPLTNIGRSVAALRGFAAQHLKAASVAYILDGGRDDGPLWNLVIRTANAASDMETSMRAEASSALATILEPVFALGSMGGNGVYFESIGRSLNREARIAIALNTGNAGNMQRLLDGEGWTMDQVQPILESLTEAEWNAVQQVWDYIDTYKPLIAEKERRLYGKEPNWVEPQPLTVRTADGKTVTLAGGYYPVKYDPVASDRVANIDEVAEAKRALDGAYTAATTRRSFTKSRAVRPDIGPLLYTLDAAFGGINDVIHDLAWHEWLIQTQRLLRDPKFKIAVTETRGPEFLKQLRDWAKDNAAGERKIGVAGEAALSWLRKGISAAGLGFNVISAALQITGFNQSIVKVGAKYVGRGIAQFVSSPIDTALMVTDKSAFMRERSRTQFREINEIRNRVRGQTAVARRVTAGTYFLMMKMQRTVDIPTWLGAYQKALDGGKDDATAVALADQAVRDTQGSGLLSDLSAIERGGPMMKLFTVFYAYMNTVYNMTAMQTMTSRSKGKLAADYVMLFVVPVVLGQAIRSLLQPNVGDDEPDFEGLARKLAAEELSYLMGTMVIAREFGGAAQLLTGAEGVRMGYGGPAGLRAVGEVYGLATQAGQLEFDRAFRRSAINTLGAFTGLPSAQINRTIDGIEAVIEGEVEGVEAFVAPLTGVRRQ